MGKCVFLGIWGLEIHIFVVNVHFFPGRGQHLPGKCVFFPQSGNLPSAGYRMAGRGRKCVKIALFLKLFWAPRALPLEKSEGFILSRVQNSSRPSPLDRGRARSLQGVPRSTEAERGGSKRLPLRQGPSGGALRRSSLDRGRVRSL